MFEAIVLGIVQGLTEFLPISSTAHLVVVPWLMGWDDKLLNSLTFDVALHAGTLLSVLICFAPDIKNMLLKDHRLLGNVLAGTIPAGVAGVLLNDYIETTFRGPLIISGALVLFGVVMYVAERYRGKRVLSGMRLPDAVVIGLAQAVALIPGTSRSGITISAGMFRGMQREEAARFSFLLSIPVIGGAALLHARHLFSAEEHFDLAVVGAGFMASLLTGVVVINLFLRFLKKHSLNSFVIYRFVLAGVLVGRVVFSQ